MNPLQDSQNLPSTLLQLTGHSADFLTWKHLLNKKFLFWLSRSHYPVNWQQGEIGGEGWIGVPKSADPLGFNNKVPPSIKNSSWIEIQWKQNKTLKRISNIRNSNCINGKIHNPGQKHGWNTNQMECCRIQKFIKILLWIWNPGFQNPPISSPNLQVAIIKDKLLTPSLP